jgi:predicted acylesterase/phospholipase RssA
MEMERTEKETEIINTIEHLVISGGCIWGFYEYGALKELHNLGFWNISNIKSIYGTSIGSVVATLLALKIDFETIDDYIIGRPWQDLWRENSYNLLETYNHLGVFHKNVIYGMFMPLFKSCDMEINISMREFYERTGIEIHIYVTELNNFEPLDISYKTHPDWEVIKAVYGSCTVPVMFAPIVEGANCYIDGGFFYNYPLKCCLDKNVENTDSILGIVINKPGDENGSKKVITEDSTFLDFTSVLLSHVIKTLFKNDNVGFIKYEVAFSVPPITIESLYKVISSKEERSTLIEIGIEKSREYYKMWTSDIS